VDRVIRSLAMIGACTLALAATATPSAVPRIVSLAPHVTELVYAAGAGSALVGASEFSDYPAAALNLPRVGDAFRLDYERIVSLRPDFVVAWESGTPAASTARLQALGVRVVVLSVQTLEDISTALVELGRLAGTSAVADLAADKLRQGFAELRQQYSGRPAVRVFVQLDDAPLFTVTGRHLISEMVGLCGGRNVFAALPGLAPAVDLEAVIAADPELILYAAQLPLALPQHFLSRFVTGEDSCDHEQQIRQPIEVTQRLGRDGFLAGEGPGAPLRAPGDRSGQVAGRRGGAAARQDEFLQWRQVGVEPVQCLLEPRDMGVGDGVVPRNAQLATEVEQVMLDPGEDPSHFGRDVRHGQCHADCAVALIDRAVGFDAGAVLGHARAVSKPRRALVAGARVDL
jgi:ABC-type hemin transport system substrate-binding protein